MLRAIAVVIGLNLGVKVFAALKDVFVARRFGISTELDGFLLASMLVAFAVNTLAASYGESFLPRYIETRVNEGFPAGRRLFESAMAFSTTGLVLLAVVLALCASPLSVLLGGRFDAASIERTRKLFLLLLPVLAVSGWTSMWQPVLNASGSYRAVAATAILTPASTLLFLAVGGRALGVHCLVLGALAGTLLEVVWLGHRVRKLGLPLLPRWRGYDPGLRRVLVQSVPLVAASFLATGSSLVDQAMAASLGPGAVSSLNYGSKVSALAVGLGSLAVSSVIFPEFSRLVADRDRGAIRKAFRAYTWLSLLSAVLPCAALLLFSQPLVRLLFERGAFIPTDTLLVAHIQQLYLLQVPFHISGLVGVRLLNALGRNHLLTGLAVASLLINAIGNLVLMRWLGVAGIALSTSLLFAAMFGLILFAVRRELKRIA